MPYVISVIIDFDLPGIELERTQDLFLQQEEMPTRADIDREIPGMIDYLLTYKSSEQFEVEFNSATVTWEIEAIFHVEPID